MTDESTDTGQGGQLYLPTDPEQWRSRVAELVKALRNEDVDPGWGNLYVKEDGKTLQASIGGIVTEQAIKGGLPTGWMKSRLEDSGRDDGRSGYEWEIETPERKNPDEFGYHFRDATNEAPPEAWIYHGMGVDEGRHHTNVFELTETFRSMTNKIHGASLGYQATESLNDRLCKEGVNPLHLFADILLNMMENPEAGFWHPKINEWGRQWREGAQKARQRGEARP